MKPKIKTAMPFPNVVQGGQIQNFPVWAKCLAKLGQYMSHQCGLKASDFPSIAVVCLPRFDYASFFLAYGILESLAVVDDLGTNSSDLDLEVLLNKTVIYRKNNDPKEPTILGRLESIDHTSGIATIAIRMSKKFYFRCEVDRSDWRQIKGSNVTFNIANGATEGQRYRASLGHSKIHSITNLVGYQLASAILNDFRPYVTVFGEKLRFIDEIESLAFNSNGEFIPAGLLLNSENKSGKYFRNSGKYIDLFASGSDLSKAKTPVVVIEAGRRLGDQIQQLDDTKNAIILVAANKHSHNDVVELLAPLINFRGRHDAVPDLGEVPQFIKTIFIR